jgi:hypothetical protein
VAPPYRLLGGTPIFHSMGELLIDLDDQRLCCGLCGWWFRALGGTPLGDPIEDATALTDALLHDQPA